MKKMRKINEGVFFLLFVVFVGKILALWNSIYRTHIQARQSQRSYQRIKHKKSKKKKLRVFFSLSLLFLWV